MMFIFIVARSLLFGFVAGFAARALLVACAMAVGRWYNRYDTIDPPRYIGRYLGRSTFDTFLAIIILIPNRKWLLANKEHARTYVGRYDM